MPTPANGRVRNSDLHDRTVAVEYKVADLASRVQDIAHNQERAAAANQLAFQRIESEQRRNHENIEKAMADGQAKLTDAINARAQEQGNNKKFSIQIVVMGMGVVMTFVIFAVGGLLAWGNMTVKSYVDGVGIPMRSDLNRLEAVADRNVADIVRGSQEVGTLRVQATTSEVDRREMRERLLKTEATLTDEVAARRAGFSALQQQLTEAERQHTMQDISRNLMHEHMMALVRMLYERAGLPVPAQPSYFPKIGREINTPIPNE